MNGIRDEAIIELLRPRNEKAIAQTDKRYHGTAADIITRSACI